MLLWTFTHIRYSQRLILFGGSTLTLIGVKYEKWAGKETCNHSVKFQSMTRGRPRAEHSSSLASHDSDKAYLHILSNTMTCMLLEFTKTLITDLLVRRFSERRSCSCYNEMGFQSTMVTESNLRALTSKG